VIVIGYVTRMIVLSRLRRRKAPIAAGIVVAGSRCLAHERCLRLKNTSGASQCGKFLMTSALF
jgi:hypothetical protein